MPKSAVSIALLIVLFVCTLAGLANITPQDSTPRTARTGYGNLPDFSVFPTAEQRKTHFLSYLRPIVESENHEIALQRARLEDMVDKLREGHRLSHTEWRWLQAMADNYGVDTAGRPRLDIATDLLRHVDVVPVSLVLVQAAKESAWGRSRFARQGNNLFGEHCFEADCGIVPKHRDAGKHHEVESFATVRASVKSYLHNLNSHPKYKQLRAIRTQLREADKPVTGLALAKGLWFYSERRQKYISEVRRMIQRNGLAELDHQE